MLLIRSKVILVIQDSNNYWGRTLWYKTIWGTESFCGSNYDSVIARDLLVYV